MGTYDSIGYAICKATENTNKSKTEDNKMDDLRIAKFETLIEDIDSEIKKTRGLFGGILRATRIMSMLGTGSGGTDKNTALALIFEYQKCNEYAKVIMDKSTLVLNSSSDNYEDAWLNSYPAYNSFNNPKNKITAAKDFVKYCRQSHNATEGYKFIFWALMMLTVDKSNAEEHLSLICDFAQMLHITDAEFEDILQTVKIIYNEVEEEYTFKSENIPSIFGSLFNLYGNQHIDEYIVEE